MLPPSLYLAAVRPHYFLTVGDVLKIAASGAVLFADHLRFTRQSPITRALLAAPETDLRLIIPVRHPTIPHPALSDILIDHRQPWPRRHLRSLELSYRYAPFFDYYFPHLQTLFHSIPQRLTDFLWELTLWQLRILFPDRPVWRASWVGIQHAQDVVAFLPRQHLQGMVHLPEESGYYGTHFPENLCHTLPVQDLSHRSVPLTLHPGHASLPLLFFLGPDVGRRLFSP